VQAQHSTACFGAAVQKIDNPGEELPKVFQRVPRGELQFYTACRNVMAFWLLMFRTNQAVSMCNLSIVLAVRLDEVSLDSVT
jgi:hypothetical protein